MTKARVLQTEGAEVLRSEDEWERERNQLRKTKGWDLEGFASPAKLSYWNYGANRPFRRSWVLANARYENVELGVQ